MSVIGHSPLAGASGAAGGSADPLYVDDVFSTFLYEGNNNTQTINNGIDISGEGGLVWVKNRTTSTSHVLAGPDLVSAGKTNLASDLTNPAGTESNYVTGFSSNGFSIGNSGAVNDSNDEYVSWTFRKASKFFDIVTYSGTGSAQNISHSLGSVPGMIMIHCLDGSHDWEVYHRETGATKSFHLNRDDAQTTDSTVWNNTTPTSSVFTVGTSSNVNQNGHGYVAYIFAHDEQAYGTDSDEAIIKCGSYTGNGTAGQEVNLGFEPQFVLLKGANAASTTWWMFDVMRGMIVGGTDERLRANDSTQSLPLSTYGANLIKPTPTGFALETTSGEANDNGTLFVYMAIRRSHKPPTTGTDVFKAIARTGTSSNVSVTGVGFPPDSHFSKIRSSGNTYQNLWFDKLRGPGTYIKPAATAPENTSTNVQLSFDQDGVTFGTNNGANGSSLNYINYFFKRAPGFFDVVAYTGTGSARTLNHNLSVVPELMIVKNRDDYYNWRTYDSINGATKYMFFNSTSGSAANTSVWNNTAPTATQFTVGSSVETNRSGDKFIAYLFATLDGISKVGSYTGTGSNINVDCGFTAGARFVLIKRTDSSGDWYVYDTARGIVSGNDPYLLFNSTAAEVTNTDYIDPLNAGFTVTSSALAALNASGGTYLFLAIA